MTSLYSTIERDLVSKIEAGTFVPDEALPTELELCDIYGVSRITVRRAVERLVAARLIYRKRGVGTFVNRMPKPGRALRLTGYMQDVLTFDRKLTAKIFDRGRRMPPKAIAERFEIEANEHLYAICAVNALDGKAYAITHSYFSPELADVAAKIRMKGGKTSIRSVEEMTGIRYRSGDQIFEALLADDDVAARLEIPTGTPILSAIRVFFSDGPKPIEAVHVFYHPTRYQVNVQLLAADSFGDRPPAAANDISG